MNRRPLIIAHRANVAGRPEGSLSGIVRAAQAGADIVELDVRRSLDGVPFVLHDAVLGRTTGGHGPIRLLPAALVRRVRLKGTGREPVPTLADALAVSPSGLELGLHLKDQGALPAVLRQVAAADAAARTWLWLHRPADARLALARLPALRITLLDAGAGRSSSGRRDYFDRAAACGASAVSVPWGAVTETLTGEAHAKGLLVFAVERDLARLPAVVAAGLDGIITDDPAGVSILLHRDARSEGAEPFGVGE